MASRRPISDSGCGPRPWLRARSIIILRPYSPRVENRIMYLQFRVIYSVLYHVAGRDRRLLTPLLQLLHAVKRRPAGESRRVFELVLDQHQPVVLSRALTSRRSTRLDLAGVERDHEIGDARVLGLARSVRHHSGIP